MSNKFRLQLGAFVIVAALSYMVLQGAHNFSSYFMTVQAYRAQSRLFTRAVVRVQGTLVSKTVHYNPENATLSFVMTSGRARLPVIYRGALPNERFSNASAIVKGSMGKNGQFVAEKLEIQCPDHYSPSKEAH